MATELRVILHEVAFGGSVGWGKVTYNSGRVTFFPFSDHVFSYVLRFRAILDMKHLLLPTYTLPAKYRQ